MKLSDFGKQFLNNPCDVMGRRESGDYQNSAFCSLWAMAVSAPNLGSAMIFIYFVFLLNFGKEKKKKKRIKKKKKKKRI